MTERPKINNGAPERTPADKPKWQPPRLTCLGRLQDIVLGGNKTGSAADGDPFVQFRPQGGP